MKGDQVSYNFQCRPGRTTNSLYLDSHIPFPVELFPRLFCGLIVSLVFLNLFPSPACFLGPSAEWCPASLKSKLQRWRVGGGARGGGWGARKAWSLGVPPLGESPSRRRTCPPPPTQGSCGIGVRKCRVGMTHTRVRGWGGGLPRVFCGPIQRRKQ